MGWGSLLWAFWIGLSRLHHKCNICLQEDILPSARCWTLCLERSCSFWHYLLHGWYLNWLCRCAEGSQEQASQSVLGCHHVLPWCMDNWHLQVLGPSVGRRL